MCESMTDTHDMPVLEVEELSKRYRDGTWANRDISFDVEPGELVGILGPNGAGKTTLVRQITTELTPTSGSVRVLGRDAVSDPDSVKPMLGVVPQEANLYWGLTVFHHLRLFGRLRGLSRRDARARADHVIESLRLHEHRDRPIEASVGRAQTACDRGGRGADPPVNDGAGRAHHGPGPGVEARRVELHPPVQIGGDYGAADDALHGGGRDAGRPGGPSSTRGGCWRWTRWTVCGPPTGWSSR